MIRGLALCSSANDIDHPKMAFSPLQMDTVSALWRLTRSISQEIEPVLLTADDAGSGFLETVQRTGIAV